MTHLKRVLFFLFTLAIFTPLALGKSGKRAELKVDEKVGVKVGEKAPTFVGIDDEKKKWDSKEKAGKKIYVIYFYPADMSPGCTKQACSYRDALADLKREDVEVIGVSGDTVENHQHFKNEYKLNFTLLADTDGKIADAFGVVRSKGGTIRRKIAGEQLTFERGVTARRWTFVIDKNWQIVHKDTKANAARDSATVMKVIEQLE